MEIREPSNSKWGEKIRKISQSKASIPLEEELHYFIEDRKWNVKHNIKPALKQNKIVIMDRYYFSTACYQGARGFKISEILQTNQEFAPEPDITFIIDVEVKTGLERIKKNRESQVKLFEKRKFLERVRKNYLQLSGKKIHIIDGNQDLDTVFTIIKKILKQNTPGYVSSIQQECGFIPKFESLKKEIITAFQDEFGIEFHRGEFSTLERELIQTLIKSKYNNDDWNFKR